MVTPDLLASQIEDLTGFRWEYLGYDMLESDLVGLRTLAGGADGTTVTRNADAPNSTLFLVQQRLAEAAASRVVEDDQLLEASERRLFTEVDFTETSANTAVTAQLVHLHRVLFGADVDPAGEEVTAGVALWETLLDASGDPAQAWSGLLSALLRDPDILFY